MRQSMNRKVRRRLTGPGSPEYLSEMGAVALERSSHTRVSTAQPSTSNPARTPSDSTKTARPIQTAHQSSVLNQSLMAVVPRSGRPPPGEKGGAREIKPQHQLGNVG